MKRALDVLIDLPENDRRRVALTSHTIGGRHPTPEFLSVLSKIPWGFTLYVVLPETEAPTTF